MEEIWKVIENTDELYECSSTGRVRRIYKNGKRKTLKSVSEYSNKSNLGYYMMSVKGKMMIIKITQILEKYFGIITEKREEMTNNLMRQSKIKIKPELLKNKAVSNRLSSNDYRELMSKG